MKTITNITALFLSTLPLSSYGAEQLTIEQTQKTTTQQEKPFHPIIQADLLNKREFVDYMHTVFEKADNEDIEALTLLGYLCKEGKGVEKDLQKSFRYYLQAATGGSIDAQFKVALKYAMGDGVELDCGKAIEFFELSGKQGHTTSLFNLGLMYLNGTGVRKDFKKAITYFELAADKGHEKALEYLSMRFEWKYNL